MTQEIRSRTSPSILEATTTTLDSPVSINRPVQYLGSKLRVLPLLRKIINDRTRSEVVWDAFTGSSVVAQALAADGHQIFASDTLLSSATFASAALGVERTTGERPEQQLQRILIHSTESRPLPGWQKYLDLEKSRIADGDGKSLLEADSQLPQRWRPNAAGVTPPDLIQEFTNIEVKAGRQEPCAQGLLSATYAGTYFGLHQSLRLEALRGSIYDLHSAGAISDWISHVALTALCSTASKAVYSAGKHFAQPHKVRQGKDLSFHARRALQDRSISIDSTFESAFRATVRSARPSGELHSALVMQAEAATVEELLQRKVSTVYADPPYTGQQYSRFYHLLETLVSGIPPELQIFRGEVTSGLYPVDRYKSSYCSRVKAPGAFRHLIETTAEAGARLVLSYSGSTSGSTGNIRTVDMAALIEMVESAYGTKNVQVLQADIKYRQFNQASAEIEGRDDPEYVIVGEVNAR